MKSWRIMRFIVVIVALLVFVLGYWLGSYKTNEALNPRILMGDKYRVVRTPGGMLEVSTLQKQEAFAWQTSWTCPANLCDSLPTSNSQISALVHYTYRIPLAEYWVLERTSQQPLRYKLKIPKPEPKLPVAVSLPSIRVLDSGSIFSPSGPTQQKMQTYMQPQLDSRALSEAYIQAQSAEAAKTVTEFARQWMRDEGTQIPAEATIEVVY